MKMRLLSTNAVLSDPASDHVHRVFHVLLRMLYASTSVMTVSFSMRPPKR
jgi:hypothetical protein